MVPGNGFCFLNAIQEVLEGDDRHDYDIGKVNNVILHHIIMNIEIYSPFHPHNVHIFTNNALHFFKT